MATLQILGGLLLLFGGGEALVKGAVAVAVRLGVSRLLIGLTLVGFGTSMPELVASVQAARVGAPGIAVGNVVGSNIANIFLILGVSAVILPIAVGRGLRRDGAVLAVSALLLSAALLAGRLSRWIGGIFVLLILAYTLYSYFSERRQPDTPEARMHEAETAEAAPKRMPLWLGLVLALAGIAAVVVGADLLLRGALTIARAAGISEAVIGLTLVAVGTSLPELATAVMAAVRRHGDVALGNVVGSNIFNSLGIIGVTALVEPIPVPPEIVRLDIWIMLAATALLILFAVTGRRISRVEGAASLALYGGYLALQLVPGVRAALGLS